MRARFSSRGGGGVEGKKNSCIRHVSRCMFFPARNSRICGPEKPITCAHEHQRNPLCLFCTTIKPPPPTHNKLQGPRGGGGVDGNSTAVGSWGLVGGDGGRPILVSIILEFLLAKWMAEFYWSFSFSLNFLKKKNASHVPVPRSSRHKNNRDHTTSARPASFGSVG